MALWGYSTASLLHHHKYHWQLRNQWNTLTSDCLVVHNSQQAYSQYTEGNHYFSLFSICETISGGLHPLLCSTFQEEHCSNFSGRPQSCLGGWSTRHKRGGSGSLLSSHLTRERAKERFHCIQPLNGQVREDGQTLLGDEQWENKRQWTQVGTWEILTRCKNTFFLTMRELWENADQRGLASPSLEILKTQMDKALSNLL